MPHPWVKICGMTREEDIGLALELGAEFVGCIVEIPRSPRCVSLDRATRLAASAQGKIVCVIEATDADWPMRVAEQVRPAALQLHAAETPELVAELHARLPEIQLWKALGVPPEAEAVERAVSALLAQAKTYAEAGAHAVLLDARCGGRFGGTGQQCDWQVAATVAAEAPIPVVLAGGLGPENVAEAARVVRPAGLDLSSGVEAEPGIKSEEMLRALFVALG